MNWTTKVQQALLGVLAFVIFLTFLIDPTFREFMWQAFIDAFRHDPGWL